MNTPAILLVGMNAEARTVSLEAVRLAFPDATPIDLPTVDAAWHQAAPATGREFLFLGEPSPAAIAQAVAATDSWGFRRWAVVVFGGEHTPEAGVAAVLKPKEWRAHGMAQVFQLALRRHALERENARLRGDLSTVGRRISHDLRTPLAAIYTAAEGLNEITPEHIDDLAVFTCSITSSSNELMRLIERMSFILKASAEPATRETVSMGEIIFATLQRVEARSLRQAARIIQPATWPKVEGVPSWLELTWLNLVTNALQHSGASPQIELGWFRAAEQFEFWVADRGPGVAPEKAGKLFQPFHLMHRLNASRGLGLSLVQRLVELQGGTCGYAPRAGGGAHFFFTLPAAKTP